MRLTCTACGAHGSIEQFTADTDARRFMDMLLQLPAPVASQALRYTALFRPHKRGLTWDRACSVLGELAAMVKAGAVENYGRSIPASADAFASAMHSMLERRDALKLPLKNHGYLVSILVANAPGQAADREQQTEQQKRSDSQARHRQVESEAERMARMRAELQKAEANRMLRLGMK
ncbi:hypothetical protein [Hydrocarboniphaga effusa]|uniref:hypothetical protein n=1 Tax=Hydrocarboniphaga effusa TaxID=243629 RepID=UPI003BA8B4DA